MFPQFGRVVSVSVMTILVALFTWIYYRDRKQRERLWMFGWAAILVHFIADLLESFSYISDGLGDWFALNTLIVAAASFVLSVCPACASRTMRLRFFCALVAPAILYATLLTNNVKPGNIYVALLGVMLIGSGLLVGSFLWRKGPAGWAVGLIVIAATLTAARKSANDPSIGMDLILFFAFAPTAYLYWKHHQRLTPGVTLASVAFLLWGSVFPVGELDDYLKWGIADDNVLWDLPKYAVAFGMILTLFENQTALLEIEISERRQAEAAAQAASLAKSQFLAQMSHEIRTPMNGVIGITDLMLNGDLRADQRRDLELIKNSAESLLLVINDILDFSRIEAGKLSLETIDFSLHQLVREVTQIIELRVQEKGLQLTCELSNQIPAFLSGDPVRLRQVLLNLLGNAVKFTSSGRVLLRVELLHLPVDEECFLRFSVLDSGIGVPEEKRQLIFEPFQQADNSTARRFGGTGLGLAISSELVKMMGGIIAVDNSPWEHGSVFSFQARFSVSNPNQRNFFKRKVPPAGNSDTPVADKPLRILIVEDSPINQLLATRLMQARGHQVTLATSGEEALACLIKDDFDVVLMDIQMPGMDGLEATHRIRENEKSTGQHIPIIAVTAHAMKGDEEKFLKAGMDAYISKPIKAHELVEKISEVVYSDRVDSASA